ncbi:MAG: hypothetical protein AAF413_02075 [Patescibacteria group bacterium]
MRTRALTGHTFEIPQYSEDYGPGFLLETIKRVPLWDVTGSHIMYCMSPSRGHRLVRPLVEAKGLGIEISLPGIDGFGFICNDRREESGFLKTPLSPSLLLHKSQGRGGSWMGTVELDTEPVGNEIFLWRDGVQALISFSMGKHRKKVLKSE